MHLSKLPRLLVASAAVTCLLAAGGCGNDDPASTRTAAAPAPVTTGAETGNLVAHGVISRAGEAVPGARVVVELWPADAAERKAGESLMSWDTRPVTTDAQGRWAINLDAARVPKDYLPTSQDFVDFDLSVFDRSQFATMSSTIYRVQKSGVWRTKRGTTADPLLDVDVDLARKQVALTDSQGRTTRSVIKVR